MLALMEISVNIGEGYNDPIRFVEAAEAAEKSSISLTEKQKSKKPGIPEPPSSLRKIPSKKRIQENSRKCLAL
jgi:hypothetical protein